MSQCASAEESGCSVEDKPLTEFWDVDGSHKLEGGTILGPLQNVTGLGMDGGCLVDWTPVKPYEEPKVTYSVSYGCTAGWSNNFSLKTLFIWFRENSHEFIVGITIALTLVPTSVAFSFIAGVDPQVGLTGSWIVALVTSITGGRPGMIYCAAGAAAVVVKPLVMEHGVEYMFLSFLLSGIFTLILGYLRVTKLVKLLPASCMIGFVNGLAIVVFLAQIETFHKYQGTKADDIAGNSFSVFKFTTIIMILTPTAAIQTRDWIKGPPLAWMLANLVISIAVNMLLPKITKFPAAFAAIVVSTAFEWGVTRPAGYRTKTVSDIAMVCVFGYEDVGDLPPVAGGLPIPIWLDDKYNIPPLFNIETLKIVAPNSIIVTAVALIEVLMTVKLVDELTETEGNAKQETLSLGISNIIASIFGGQGGHSDIGLTLINITSGGRLRIPGVVAGLFTLTVILGLYLVINIIPISGLTGVMTVVVYHIFDWPSLPLVFQSLLPSGLKAKLFSNPRNKISRMDALAVLVVTIVTPFTNLALAVACGCAVVFLGYTWQSADSLKIYSYCRTSIQSDDPGVIKVYEIRGPMYFASCNFFLKSFDHHNDPYLIELHFQQADIFDYSALQAINTLGKRYSVLGKRVRLRLIKGQSLKVLIDAKDLFTNLVSLEMESDFEKPGPFIGLNRETCDESAHRRIREANLTFHSFIHQNSVPNGSFRNRSFCSEPSACREFSACSDEENTPQILSTKSLDMTQMTSEQYTLDGHKKVT